MKKWIEEYKKLQKTPKGRALLFFGFYFVFFAAIFTFLRFSGNPVPNMEESVDENYSFDVNSLIEMNAHYQYTVSLDNTKYIYDGFRDGKQELFKFQEKDYYYNGENYFVNEDMWIKSENPYKFYDFIDFSKVSFLFKESYLDSETTYKSGKTVYHYLVDTNTIYQLLLDKHTDYMDDGNMIVVNENQNKQIESIVFQLDGYCKSIESCQKTLKLEIEYDGFGTVENITNPMK